MKSDLVDRMRWKQAAAYARADPDSEYVERAARIRAAQPARTPGVGIAAEFCTLRSHPGLGTRSDVGHQALRSG
jgi:hypothetical protein